MSSQRFMGILLGAAAHGGASSLGSKIVRIWMERAQRRAGLPVTGGVHVLRHSFCSHLAMQGAPAKAIQELAGHSNLTTTMKYMHLTPGARDAAIRLLDRRPATDEGGGDVGETGAG